METESARRGKLKFVAQAFQPAGFGDFPVASSKAERDWKVP
jgi:hypothetical protein